MNEKDAAALCESDRQRADELVDEAADWGVAFLAARIISLERRLMKANAALQELKRKG